MTMFAFQAEGLLPDQAVTVAATQTVAIPKPPEPCRRTILLSGFSRLPGSLIRMDGVLFGYDRGRIEGEIMWTNVETRGFRPGLAGAELVRGTAGHTDLQFQGHQIDRPFTLERYRLILFGSAEAGVFSGVSEAYGAWDCRLAGSYQVVVERG